MVLHFMALNGSCKEKAKVFANIQRISDCDCNCEIGNL